LAAVDAAAISLEAALARAASSGTGVTGVSGAEPTPGLAVDPDGAAGAAAVVTALLTVSDYRDRRAAQTGVRVVPGVRPVPGVRVVAARVREVGGTVPCRQATCASAALSRQAESLPSSFDEDHALGSRLRVYAKLGCILAVFAYRR